MADDLSQLRDEELLVAEVEHTREDLRGQARERLGVTGDAAGMPPLRDVLRLPGVHAYPLVALGVLSIVDTFHAYAFAVFVDRAPQPPGKSLAWLAHGDKTCRPAEGCPDSTWYAQRNVFTTTDTSFRIERLARQQDGRREMHEVTVVLLDADGRRIGETGWTLQLQVARDG